MRSPSEIVERRKNETLGLEHKKQAQKGWQEETKERNYEKWLGRQRLSQEFAVELKGGAIKSINRI